ncbi:MULTISPECIES: hypothetical protein [unclassified Microcystis]|uniref:hypothetical protein n=1 Tax=unclassified Microcystis TaxID=2643300 RepID=UPI00257C0475|nr:MULTISPECIES: hypothetical protein [unclassified Microcystis]
MKWMIKSVSFALIPSCLYLCLFPSKVGAFGKGPWYLITFSLEYVTKPALDGNKNPIYDNKRNPVYETKIVLDPPPSDPVTRFGTEIIYNPNEVQISEDSLSYGFLCEFTSNGGCPTNDGILSATFGSPLGNTNTSWSFNINNQAGLATLNADFSNNPVDVEGHTYFFGFTTLWSDTKYFSQSTVTLQNEYCKTISTETTDQNGCGEPIPEPTSTLSILSLGILGAGATIKRKVKRSHSTEKEPSNVS